jgi:hypothetical protein
MNIVRIDYRHTIPVAHCAIASTSIISCSNVAVYASGFARIRTSILPPIGSILVRASSRNRRFVRFRSTILRRYFGTTTPTLGWSNREADARASRRSVCIRFPVRLTDSKSASLVSRVRRAKPRGLRASVFRRQLDSEPFASLLAPAAKNFTSPFSGHSQPEAMRPDTTLVARTVGGLAHQDTPKTEKINCRIEPVKLFQP